MYSAARQPQWARTFPVSKLRYHTVIYNTICRTPLDEWSRSMQKLLPDNGQYSQERDSHTPDKVRTCNSYKRAAAYRHLRSRGHRYRRSSVCSVDEFTFSQSVAVSQDTATIFVFISFLPERKAAEVCESSNKATAISEIWDCWIYKRIDNVVRWVRKTAKSDY
jgi:hypothetical protein